MVVPSFSEETSSHPASLFQQIEAYNWSADQEFQDGLRVLLGSHTLLEGQAEHLKLRARCFYFSRKNNIRIPFDAFQEWRNRHSSSPAQPASGFSIAASGSTSPTPVESNEGSSQHGIGEEANVSTVAEAQYPTSFNHIVELITNGQPVPGIKDVPNTTLIGQDSPAVTARRKKPWEQVGKGDGISMNHETK